MSMLLNTATIARFKQLSIQYYVNRVQYMVTKEILF